AHEGAHAFFVEGFEVAGPIVLVAEAPEDHRRVIAVLVDHIAQHAPCLLAIIGAADAATAPWDLLPHDEAEFVAQLEREAGALIMAEADEVAAHLFHELEFLADQVVGESGGESRVVLVALRAFEKQLLAVEAEEAVRRKFEGAEAEA